MVKRFWGRLIGKISGIKSVGTLGRAVGALCAVVAFVQVAAMNTVMAAEAVSIPDIGIDWADVGTKAAATIGIMVAGLIGIKIALAIINAGTRMLGRMLS